METNPKSKQLIFLVDDDQEDRELFVEALSQVDSTVKLTEIPSCDKLMEMLDNPTSPKPDIIFLDLDMPRFNGLDCLKKLKASHRIDSLNVVVLSTFSHEDYVQEAYHNGAIRYYVKPANFEKLKGIISHALNNSWKSVMRDKKNFIGNYQAT